jgi:enoyl-CoA hydratase
VLNHGKVNAMDIELLESLTTTFQSLAISNAVGAAVLTGTGSVFSAGVDLKRLIGEPPAYLDRFFPALRKLFFEAFIFPKPLVGAINGHALAGGCVLASCCDYRLLSREAKIGMPELRVGLPLPPEGIEILRFVAATQHLQRIVTSGKTFVNESAVTAGLADESVPADVVRSRAKEIAHELLSIPANVFHLSKRQIRQPVINLIHANETQFISEIDPLWRDPKILSAVAEYVKSRL